jgi:hypothetical protein
MSGSPHSSFIPKHTTNKPERKSTPRQLFIGTLIVRILFFAVLIAAVGVFFYERNLTKQLMVEVTNFKAAASAYTEGEEKLVIIQNIDKRLAQAKHILSEDVSLAALFTAIERSTISTVQIQNLSISQEEPGLVTVDAKIKTDTFDSTMFQRLVFEQSDILSQVQVSDVTVQGVTADEEGERVDPSIEFSAIIAVEGADIPAVVVTDNTFVPVSDVSETPNNTTATATESGLDIGFDG